MQKKLKILSKAMVCGQLLIAKVFTDVDAECHIEYLPPYLPNFNLIKQVFSTIKAYLRCHGITFFAAKGLYCELYQACDIITPEMTWGFFSHSRYMV